MFLMKESIILGLDCYGLLNIIRCYLLVIELRLGFILQNVLLILILKVKMEVEEIGGFEFKRRKQVQMDKELEQLFFIYQGEIIMVFLNVIYLLKSWLFLVLFFFRVINVVMI